MTEHGAPNEMPTVHRLSRRAVSARGLAIGLAVPAAGALAVTEAAAQATPVSSDRVAINPGENFSSAIVANGVVYVSGALGVDPETGDLAGDDITSQTEQVMSNIEATLKEAGSSMDRVVKSTCFLKNIDDFQDFNEAYRQFFSSDRPARSTVEVSALALEDALVEIDVIALV